MSDNEAVLLANESFYRAFAESDIEAMEALWAEARPVACIHPGWTALTDRASVMDSWRAILGNGGASGVRCDGATVFLHGDAAFVTCYEVMEPGILVATNVFVRDGGAWRMVHHQAGPANLDPQTVAKDTAETMH